MSYPPSSFLYVLKPAWFCPRLQSFSAVTHLSTACSFKGVIDLNASFVQNWTPRRATIKMCQAWHS
eukprot:4898529-Pleurochrysis_carterae.AAC.1